jgi:hypothetical protein
MQLTSVAALRDAAVDWDDLWWRSVVAMPTARAELLAQWIEHFQPRHFHALVIRDAQRWVAALPLVSTQLGWVVSVGGLPTNPWCPCGELLLDPAVDAATVLDRLLVGIAELPWPLLWLNEATHETPQWQELLAACGRAGLAAVSHEHFRVGRLELDSTWEIFQQRLAKNHRRGMRRALQRLASEGDLQFEMSSAMPVEEVEPWLQAAFDLENRGWKGTAGTSVLRTPGMFEFFLRQGRQLAAWGQLEAAALRLDGRLLAFVSGFRAKGTYFPYKIGYDADFAAFSPGQLLFHHIFERLYEQGDVRTVDFMGPLTDATSRWRSATYGIGRIVLAPHSGLGRTAIYAYKHWWRPLRDRKAGRLQRQPR